MSTIAHAVKVDVDKIIVQKDPLRGHIDDAAMAAQLTPPTDKEWLEKCEKVRKAQNLIKIL